MTVKIITDSTSDLPLKLAENLGVEIVPGYISFGKDTFRDGVEISRSEFYRQLMEYPLPPVTSEASVKDFTQVYLENQYTPDGIVSIHISSKISKMYESAVKGSKKAKPDWPLAVLDSGLASIGLGLAVVNAAKLAQEGKQQPEIVKETKKAFGQIEMLGLFDTLKYAARGGHVTRHIKELSAMHRVKPLLTFRKGELVSEGLVKTYETGIERLYQFLANAPKDQDIGIAYTTGLDTARALRERLGSAFPLERIYLTQISAAIGAHCGPDAIFVAKRILR